MRPGSFRIGGAGEAWQVGVRLGLVTQVRRGDVRQGEVRFGYAGGVRPGGSGKAGCGMVTQVRRR